MFGYPSDATDEEKVVLALTFAPVPETGVFDTDMLYRLQVNPHARASSRPERRLEPGRWPVLRRGARTSTSVSVEARRSG